MIAELMAALPPRVRRFLDAVARRRVPLATFVIGVALVATVISLFLPKWYTARSVLLPPPESSDSFGIMTGMIQSSALSQLGLLSTSTPSDVFAEILRSRTLNEELIQRYDLMRSYRCKNMDLALKALSKHMGVDVSKAGLLEIHMEDRDPRRAAEMVNYLVAMLDRFNRETFSTKAKRTREFLESRLADVVARLEVADSALTDYERRHKVLASNEEGAAKGVADVMAQKMNLQVRRSYVSSYSRPDSPALATIDAEMEAVERELAKLPMVKQEGARLALNVEIQRKVFTLLTAQYEQARVEERRDTPTITVLDAARPPLLKSRPKRSIVVLVATGAALAMGLGWVGLTQLREPAA